jgi:His/Glu/Gln/Arg/opine family amino acid ABC transporter permease subunit
MEAIIQTIAPYLPMILSGAAVTIVVGLAAFMLAVAIGLLGAWAKLSRSRPANALVSAYTTVIRGVPDLVSMLLLYYGGQMLLNKIGEATGLWGYVEISAFAAGILTIGLVFGAYLTETFRGAALAIPRGQIEAGLSCGMPPHWLFVRIIWPQLIRYALPGLGNNFQVLIKTTALVSIIGLQDLVFNAFQAGRSTHAIFLFMGITFLIYLLITALSGLAIRGLELRYGAKNRPAHS